MGNARIINPKPRETQIQNDKPTDHRQQELQSKSAALEIKGKGNEDEKINGGIELR